MSFIPAQYAEVTTVWRVPGGTEPIISVFGLWDSDNTGDLDIGIGNVATAYPLLLAVLPSQLTLDRLTIVDSDGNEREAELGVAGSGGGDCAPPQVTYLVTKRTNMIGRANKGRWFLPGVDEGEVDAAGFLSAGHRSSINGGLDAFKDSLTSDSWPMAVLHAEAGPVPRIVTALQVQAKVATLKQRVR